MTTRPLRAAARTGPPFLLTTSAGSWRSMLIASSMPVILKELAIVHTRFANERDVPAQRLVGQHCADVVHHATRVSFINDTHARHIAGLPASSNAMRAHRPFVIGAQQLAPGQRVDFGRLVLKPVHETLALSTGRDVLRHGQ